MAGKPIAGDGFNENLAGMTKNQLYDIMSQMKTLIEQNRQQAREILIQNPPLTKALFQAQIMLGMVQPPQAIPNVHPAATHRPQQASQPSQQSNVQATHPLPVPKQEQKVVPQIQPPMRKQHQNQNLAPTSSSALHPPNLQPQPIPSHPLQTQQPKGHMNPQMNQMSIPQSSQLPTVPLPPHHSATQPPTLHQPQMTNVSTQLQQPIQTSGAHHLPLQTSVAPQPQMPSGPGFNHQYGPPMGPNAGFQHGVPQHPSQSVFHPVDRPQMGVGPSFPQRPPHHQSQLPPPYKAGGSHMGGEFNNPMQGDRGSWMSGPQESSPMAQLLAPPQLVPGQMGPARPSSLTPEMEKALLQQVMSLTPEQINLLPPEQRNQVLQLQQMLRQ